MSKKTFNLITGIIGGVEVIAIAVVTFINPQYAVAINSSIGIVGTAVLVLLFILEIFVIATTKTRSAIHDLISDCVVVDFNSQMVFENADELMEYKTRIHAEEVNKKEY